MYQTGTFMFLILFPVIACYVQYENIVRFIVAHAVFHINAKTLNVLKH